MRNEIVLRQIKDVEAAVGHLIDKGIEVVSIHIGPVNLPPTIRVRPCDWTATLRSRAQASIVTGEMRLMMRDYELAWSEAETPGSQIARLNHALREISGELPTVRRAT